MSKNKVIRANSDLYARIRALPLTPAEQAVAIHGLRGGEMIADTILAVITGLKRLASGSSALKPSLKH